MARWARVGAQAARHRSHEGQSNPLSHMECHIDKPHRSPTRPPTATLRPDSSAALPAAPPFSRSTLKARTGRQSGNSPRSFPPLTPGSTNMLISRIDHLGALRACVPQVLPFRQSVKPPDHEQPGSPCSLKSWQLCNSGPCSTSLSDEDLLQRGHKRRRTAASARDFPSRGTR